MCDHTSAVARRSEYPRCLLVTYWGMPSTRAFRFNLKSEPLDSVFKFPFTPMPRARTGRGRLKNISCPHCRKKFHSETNVLRHMNQPTGDCYGTNWYQVPSNTPQHQEDDPGLGSANDPVGLGASHFPTSGSEARGSAAGYYPLSPRSDSGLADIYQNLEDHRMELDDSDARQSFTELYPDCSDSYPGGSTFMDTFWQDEHTQERRVNLYFPFASAEEWQLASWRLRSGLSMAAIDSLLSLTLVGHRCLKILL